MPIMAKVIFGLLVLIVIYIVVWRVVNSPWLHMFAKLQYDIFIHNVYADEAEEKNNTL